MEGKPLKIISLYRRIPMSQVPDDETEAAAWLQKLYQEKVLRIFDICSKLNSEMFPKK